MAQLAIAINVSGRVVCERRGDTLTSMLLGLRHFVSPFAVRFVGNYDHRPVAHWEIDLLA